jgi:hypothetical protein
MHRNRMRFHGFVAVALFAGCAHAESFDGGVLRKGALRIELGPVPASWRRVHVEGADLAFRDDERGGSTLFDVRCGGRDDDAPLGILTQNLVMGTTERDFAAQDVIPFDGREAMHSRLRAKLDGVPMQYDIYVMKKDGCVYDLVYVAPPEQFEAGTTDFERFVGGFRTSASANGVAPSARESSAGAASRDP